MNENRIEDVVSHVLRSPTFIRAIQNCIRNEGALPSTSTNVVQNAVQNRTAREIESCVQTEHHVLPSNSNQNVVPSRTAREELHRLFPSINRRNSAEIVGNKRKKQKKDVSYSVDVILLRDPYEKRTVIGKMRAKAYETGFALSSVELQKTMSHIEIKDNLKALFSSKLGNIDISILIPMGGYLVEPRLTESQNLDGLNMFKLFYRPRKVVYLRPVEPLQHQIIPNFLNVVADEETEEHVEDNFHDFYFEDYCNDNDNNKSSESITDDIVPPKSLDEIVNNFRQKINDEKTTIFNVYRENVFQCYLRGVKRKTFSPFNKISVCFVDSEDNSEGAIDAGGPRRELFRLLLKQIKNARIFEGNDDAKYIILNKDALVEEEYYEVGKLIVLSIVHCGLGPHFFSEFLFQHIIQNNIEPTINDITNSDIKAEILLAIKCENLNDLRDVISEGTYIRLAGWDYLNDFEKKDRLIKDVLKFYAIERVAECVKQLIDGLNTMGFYNMLKKYPEYFIEVFCKNITQILDVAYFESLFNINYSEEGSNKRQREAMIVAFWKDYLIECYESDSSDLVTLEEILSFCTGASVVPLFGFDSHIALKFLHNDDCPFPKANTCALELLLPTVHNDYDTFKLQITYGFKNGMVFGLV